MRAIISPVCGVALAVSGCVAFPELESHKKISVVNVVKNIECELQASILNDLGNHYWLLGWATTITLDLETDNASAGTGDIELTVPFSSQLFGLTLYAGPEKEFKSAGTFSYSTYFADIASLPCTDDDTEKKASELTGRTGAGDWLTRVADNATRANFCPLSIDFGLEFTLSIDGSGNPTISGITIGDADLDGGVSLVGETVTDQELTLSAVPVADGTSESDQEKVARIFSKATSLVYEQTGKKVSKDDILACLPFDGTLAVAQREQVNPETQDSLDKAVAGSLLRSLAEP